MLRRGMLIGVLVVGLMGVLQAEVVWGAYSLGGGGLSSCTTKTVLKNGVLSTQTCCGNLCSGCYWFQWVIVGGSNPNDCTVALLATSGTVLNSSLICKNPGGDFDVRQGMGGTTFDTVTPLSDSNLTYDSNGKHVAFVGNLCSWKSEELRDENGNLLLNCSASTGDPTYPTVFDITWKVDNTSCRNSNWDTYAYFINDAELQGTLYSYCTDLNNNGIIDPLTECDLTKKTDSAKVYCETKQDARSWVPGSEVNYLCVLSPSPIAWNDYYSATAGKTLAVRAPGVLANDHDTGPSQTSLTASRYEYVEGGVLITSDVHGGTLVFNTDGSFKYTPRRDFTGVDSFRYIATDRDGNSSNVATVEFTVTK